MSHITLVCSMLVLMPFPCPPRDPRPSFPPLNSSVENVSPSEPVCHRHGRQASSISDKRSFGGPVSPSLPYLLRPLDGTPSLAATPLNKEESMRHNTNCSLVVGFVAAARAVIGDL